MSICALQHPSLASNLQDAAYRLKQELYEVSIKLAFAIRHCAPKVTCRRILDMGHYCKATAAAWRAAPALESSKSEAQQ
jgi:hypothetical protein